jgi:hypothetical protein
MADQVRMIWLVDPDGTVRDYPEGHYHVRAARDGVTLSGELSDGRRVEDRSYRLATDAEVRAALAQMVAKHTGSVEGT